MQKKKSAEAGGTVTKHWLMEVRKYTQLPSCTRVFYKCTTVTASNPECCLRCRSCAPGQWPTIPSNGPGGMDGCLSPRSMVKRKRTFRLTGHGPTRQSQDKGLASQATSAWKCLALQVKDFLTSTTTISLSLAPALACSFPLSLSLSRALSLSLSSYIHDMI